ncbi:Uncharacterised protein [uncultured archaeon]|nr:Uncharacterised protein [uncultured archaeon]
MNAEDYLLSCLSEECGEVVQLVGKSHRFGLDDFYVAGPTNRQKLAQEINDIIAVAEMLTEFGVDLPGVFDREAQQAKKNKVYKYMAYSRERGRLDQDTKG